MAVVPEVTMICVDNSYWVKDGPNDCAQFRAIDFYCSHKMQLDSRNLVGLFAMSSSTCRTLVPPTSNFGQIRQSILDLFEDGCEGYVDFESALKTACCELVESTPNVKRRLFVLVGSPIDLHITGVKELALMLKSRDIALDVVNFFYLDTCRVEDPVLYRRRCTNVLSRLVELVTILNDATEESDSHMVDTGGFCVEGGSYFAEILSESISRKKTIKKKNKDKEDDEHDKEKKNEDEPSDETCNVEVASREIEIDGKSKEEANEEKSNKEEAKDKRGKYQNKKKLDAKYEDVGKLTLKLVKLDTKIEALLDKKAEILNLIKEKVESHGSVKESTETTAAAA